MDSNDEDEGVSPQKSKLPVNLLISEGNKYFRLSRLERAMSSFQLVLKHDPGSVKALLGRARCQMRLGKYDEGLQDFEHVLKLNPKCTEAIYLKGEAEYLKGNFEKSFSTYWEGFKDRPCDQMLRFGHQMCECAIKNNLRADASMLLNSYDVSKLFSLLRSRDADMKEDKGDSKTHAKRDLLSRDLRVLDDLLKDKKFSSIHSYSKDVVHYINMRQRFGELLASGLNKPSKTQTIQDNTCHPTLIRNSLLRQLEKCRSSLEEGDTATCLKEGSDILDTLRNLSTESYPEKSVNKALTLHLLGFAHLLEGNVASALACCKEQLTIARDGKFPDVEGRSLRDMGEIYLKNRQYGKAFRFFVESSEFAQPLENYILLYKLSDCATHLNDFEYARKAANKCLEFALRSRDTRFVLDVVLLLAEIAVKCKDAQVAEKRYREALEIAIECQDPRLKDVKYLLRMVQDATGLKMCNDERIHLVNTAEKLKEHSIEKDLQNTSV